jgi:hypothetical protein
MESFNFIISLAPYEKELLNQISLQERLSPLPPSDEEINIIIDQLFVQWNPHHAYRFSINELRNDILTLHPSSSDGLKRAYQHFLNRLKSPFYRDATYRADMAKRDNPDFVNRLCQATDIEQFLSCISATINRAEDLGSWRTLAAMLQMLPDEMSCWTYTWDDSTGFDIWKVVRMFQNCLHRPNSASMLLDYCRKYPDSDFGKYSLTLYHEEREKMIHSWEKAREKPVNLESPGHLNIKVMGNTRTTFEVSLISLPLRITCLGLGRSSCTATSYSKTRRRSLAGKFHSQNQLV